MTSRATARRVLPVFLVITVLFVAVSANSSQLRLESPDQQTGSVNASARLAASDLKDIFHQKFTNLKNHHSSEPLTASSKGSDIDQITFNPTTATYFDFINTTPWSAVNNLTDSQLSLLKQTGFVVLNRNLSSLGDFYHHAFKNDLPAYITPDAILHAYHRSFDDLETHFLEPSLKALLNGMHRVLNETVSQYLANDESQAKSPGLLRTFKDVDTFLTVARRLLFPSPILDNERQWRDLTLLWDDFALAEHHLENLQEGPRSTSPHDSGAYQEWSQQVAWAEEERQDSLKYLEEGGYDRNNTDLEQALRRDWLVRRIRWWEKEIEGCRKSKFHHCEDDARMEKVTTDLERRKWELEELGPDTSTGWRTRQMREAVPSFFGKVSGHEETETHITSILSVILDHAPFSFVTLFGVTDEEFDGRTSFRAGITPS
ncbi:hypothetical protein HDV00_010768 [Rhizophlyctis rosea]|nr:hypothetical protein HDV00_010768 [Rhizophlyctis rosea]